MAWYQQPSLAFGDESDVRACAQVFADVSEAMSRALPAALEFNNSGEDTFSSESADEIRSRMEGIPELLRRFAAANEEVASALRQFAPKLTDYRHELQSLQNSGRSRARDIEQVERERVITIDRIRSEESDLGQVLVGWMSDYAHHPEVRTLDVRLDGLQAELDRLERHFEIGGEDFNAAIDRAAELIWNADWVLYDGAWDRFWSQWLEDALAFVRTILEVVAVILTIAALIGSGGTLAPLIVAGLLLAVSIAQIAGNAAAGREITGEMWLSLTLDVAAVATLGAARHAHTVKIAGAAQKAQADKILKLGRGKASVKHMAKLQEVSRLQTAQRTAEKTARGFEMVEGGLSIGAGVNQVAQGNQAGWVSIGVGAMDVAPISGPALDAAHAGKAAVGAGQRIVDGAESAASAVEPRSPKEWPGLPPRMPS